MSAPKRIFAWRYHPDNEVPRALGAWDSRRGQKTKDDVDYVRADIAGQLRSALRMIVESDQGKSGQIARAALEKYDGRPYVSIFDKRREASNADPS